VTTSNLSYFYISICSGQHYYWDWSSDLVSWLPPGHPKCQISQPASQLREELHLKAGDQDDNMSSDDSTSDQEQMEVSSNQISCI